MTQLFQKSVLRGESSPEHPKTSSQHIPADGFFSSSTDFPFQSGHPLLSPLPRQDLPPPLSWLPVTQPCSGDPTWAAVGFPGNRQQLSAAQQNMSILHKQFPCVGAGRKLGEPPSPLHPHPHPHPAFFSPFFFFFPLNQPKSFWGEKAACKREREMTQVFCNLSHSELQFRGRKEGSKIVAPTPDCITEIPPPLPPGEEKKK